MSRTACQESRGPSLAAGNASFNTAGRISSGPIIPKRPREAGGELRRPMRQPPRTGGTKNTRHSADLADCGGCFVPLPGRMPYLPVLPCKETGFETANAVLLILSPSGYTTRKSMMLQAGNGILAYGIKSGYNPGGSVAIRGRFLHQKFSLIFSLYGVPAHGTGFHAIQNKP